jgi:hypothetical protein
MAIDRNKYRTSRFLKASDLTAPRTRVSIKGVCEELLGEDKKQPRLVLELNENLKPLVLNGINTDMVLDLFGVEETTWIGKPIVLVKTKVAFNGRYVDAIRIEASPSATVAA